MAIRKTADKTDLDTMKDGWAHLSNGFRIEKCNNIA